MVLPIDWTENENKATTVAKCIYTDLRGAVESLNRLFGKYIGCEEVTRFATYCSIVYV